MKKHLLIATVAITLFASCTEKGPLINFGTVTAKDTTYVSTTIETPQAHNILAEEFTGGNCSNCPAGHAIVAQADSIYSPHFIPIAIHYTDPNNSTSFPAPSAAHDFRTAAGTYIANSMYGGVNSLPSLGVDRISYSGSMTNISKSTWLAEITSRTSVTNAVNMYVQSTYTASTNTAAIQVTVAYTAIDTNAEFLTIAIVEDSLYDLQLDNRAGHGPVDNNYLFNHILRDVVTGSTGDAIPNNLIVKQAGTKSIRNYSYPLNSAWNPAHCKVVAFIFNNKKEVLQAVEAKIAP